MATKWFQTVGRPDYIAYCGGNFALVAALEESGEWVASIVIGGQLVEKSPRKYPNADKAQKACYVLAESVFQGALSDVRALRAKHPKAPRDGSLPGNTPRVWGR